MRQTRTPLTRRYLTEVENELARTKALLLRFMPEAETSQNVNFSEPITEQVFAQDGESFQNTELLHQSPELNTRIQSPASLPGLDIQPKPHTASQTSELGIVSHQLHSASVGRHGEFADQSPVYSDQQTHGPSGLSLETPPSSNNFEWDGRTGKPSGDKFVDGMASLTSDANEGGYLGVASGAALLRINDTASTELTDRYDSERYMDSVNHTSRSIPFALTSLGQLEPFVESYFSPYHRSYPIVHEATFRAQFMEVIPRPSGNVWYVLLFVLSAVGAFSPFPSAAELIELDDRLIGSWLGSLPPYFQEHVIQTQKFCLCHSIMRWRYRNFRIFMYRPFLVGRLMARPEREGELGGTENESEIAIERCLDAARESVELIANFWEQEQQSMLACWYGLYFLFQAILIPVICLRNNPQHMLAEDWRRQILQAMPVLESMAHLNPSSSRCLEVIRSLCGSHLDPSIVGWGPTEESPQTQLANLYPLMWPTLDTVQPDGMDSIL
ncbi:hypothetical protein N7488_007184 [Penicillium malachiteum]|nr:hypothetical protein N7488_007184 [Penicillium malachiteum]